MQQQKTQLGKVIAGGLFGVVWGAIALAPSHMTVAHAAEKHTGRLELTSTNIVERDLTLSEADQVNPVQKLDFDEYFETDNWLRYKVRLSGVDGYHAALQFVDREYFDRSDLSGFTIMPQLEYWKQVSDRLRVRVRGDFAHRVRDGDHYFDRMRGEVRLRYQIAPLSRVFVTGTVSHTDYNESVLRGFDQMQYRLAAERRWYAEDHRSYFSIGAFSEWTDADLARASFTHYGPEARLIKWLDEITRLRVRARYRLKKFDDNFSAADPVKRNDRRPSLSLDLRRNLDWGGALVGGVGWLDNRSNITIRDADGITAFAGIEFKHRFNH
ncbi:MAG: hypothetical protein ABF335_05735 [Alphaproteobacteria bacterium]